MALLRETNSEYALIKPLFPEGRLTSHELSATNFEEIPV